MIEAQRAALYWRNAWELSADRYSNAVSSEPPLEEELRAELLFCLLGGFGVTYELNRSAADRLLSLGLLLGEPMTAAVIERELRTPQFQPPRTNGELRRYRFPRRKAELLASAQEWLEGFDALADTLASLEDERERRRLTCECPGVGPKTASWLLRNTGLARELAILDVHVVRAMQGCDLIAKVYLPRDYETVELAYLGWCAEVGSDPAGFDLMVWDLSRQRV